MGSQNKIGLALRMGSLARGLSVSFCFAHGLTRTESLGPPPRRPPPRVTPAEADDDGDDGQGRVFEFPQCARCFASIILTNAHN